MAHRDDYSIFFGEDRPLESEPEFEAYREKIISAEKISSGIKAIVVLINAIVYLALNLTGFFQPNGIENRPVLAYTILALSFLYSGLSYILRPSEKYPTMLVSYFSYVSDIIFITLLLYATGGYASPFYILWYMAIVSIALRFNWRIMWVTSVIYTVSYFSLLLVLSHVHSGRQLAELLLRCSYILVIGHISSLISKETYEQAKEKNEVKNMAKSLLQAQAELHEKTIELENLNALLEDKVTERTKGMEASAKNFGLLLDSLQLLTWTTTPDGTVTYHNKAWDKFFNGAVDGSSLNEFIHPDDLGDVFSKWRRAQAEGAPAEGVFRWKRNDGVWVPMDVHLSCLRDEDGEIIMWVGTASEIAVGKQ